MNADDLQQAAHSGSITVNEEVFRILVTWPDEGRIDGATDPDLLMRSLQTAAGVLLDDDTIMPAPARLAIMGAFPENPVEPMTFAEGSAAVSSRPDHWRKLFSARASTQQMDSAA